LVPANTPPRGLDHVQHELDIHRAQNSSRLAARITVSPRDGSSSVAAGLLRDLLHAIEEARQVTVGQRPATIGELQETAHSR
jgi:hypothetical protein